MDHWSYLTTAIVVAAALSCALVARRHREANQRRGARFEDAKQVLYTRKPLVLSCVEQDLYTRLAEALPDHLVLAQVAVNQVIDVHPEVRHPLRAACFNHIASRSVDFLICTKQGAAILAIELDDSTHKLPRRRRADLAKNRAFEHAGLQLLRIPVSRLPSLAEIMQLVNTPAAQPSLANAL